MQLSQTQTKVHRELLFEFFLTFARFENALKTTGFVKKHPINAAKDAKFPPAEPDWDSFAVSHRGLFSINDNPRLAEACDYILNSPPNRQIIRTVPISWFPVLR